MVERGGRMTDLIIVAATRKTETLYFAVVTRAEEYLDARRETCSRRNAEPGVGSLY
jgi:hypothetical protein